MFVARTVQNTDKHCAAERRIYGC